MRLVTRSDFDGLVCAVLLVEQRIVDSYHFVHPKDIQDGKVEITSNDVLANVPYQEGCGLWFDHHSSENKRVGRDDLEYEGTAKDAPSAAQVIWEHYGGEDNFGSHFLPMLEAVNKSDSGDLTSDEILQPEDWILLSFIMDGRTGLGRFKDYRISNYQLMLDMVQYCRTRTAEEIMEIEDVQERIGRYFDQQDRFVQMLSNCCTLTDNVIITDLTDQETVFSGNRFLVYALYTEQNVEVRAMWGKDQQNVVLACGHSILNRTCQTNIGELMLEYGGGGHRKVGTCQVPVDSWVNDMMEIVETLKQNG